MIFFNLYSYTIHIKVNVLCIHVYMSLYPIWYFEYIYFFEAIMDYFICQFIILKFYLHSKILSLRKAVLWHPYVKLWQLCPLTFETRSTRYKHVPEIDTTRWSKTFYMIQYFSINIPVLKLFYFLPFSINIRGCV